MKKLFCIAVFAAALFAPTQAKAWDYGPYKVNGGVKIYLNIQTGPANLPLAPWYLYYPAEARNLPVGPPGYYPNWPAQLPPGGPVTPPAPERVPPPAQAPPIQQTGYFTISSQPLQAPSYWYGR